MQRNTLAPSSKLKTRHGDDSEHAANYDGNGEPKSSRRRSRSRRKRKAPYKVKSTSEIGAFFSVLKGIFIIMLLAGGFYWAASREYSNPFPNRADASGSSTAAVTVNASQSTNTTTTAATIQPAPTTEQSTNQDATAAIATVSDTTEATTAVAIESSDTTTAPDQTAAAAEPEDQDIRIAKVDTTIQTTTVNTAASTESSTQATTETNTQVNTEADSEISTQEANVATSAVSTASVENETAQPVDTPIPDASHTVKTYRATMFSDLKSVDAIETPVEHGAAVTILERAGEWVKIKVENDGEIGYIHITQLSGG